MRTALSEMLEDDTEEALVVADGGEPLGAADRSTRSAAGSRPDAAPGSARSHERRRSGWVLLAQSSGRVLPRPQPRRLAASPTTASARAGPATTSTATRTRSCSTSSSCSSRRRSGFVDRVRRSRSSPTGAAGSSRRSRRSPAILYTIPSLAAFFLLLPLTGRGTTTAVIALCSLHAADPLPQHAGRPRRRPRGRARRRPRHGLHRPPAALARRGAAGAARHPGRPADRADDDRRAWRRSPSTRARAAWASRWPRRSDFKTNVVLAGGLCVADGGGARRPGAPAPAPHDALDAEPRRHDRRARLPGPVRRRGRLHPPRARGAPAAPQVGGGQLIPLRGQAPRSSPAPRSPWRSSIALPVGLWLGHTRRGALPRRRPSRTSAAPSRRSASSSCSSSRASARAS